MATLESISPQDLRNVVVAFRDALRAHQDRLNRLNVYPVPDGDTGTNMALTLESVVAGLEGATDMASTTKAVSHGSLMGARGNSGVILSQVLRGMCERLSQPGDDGGEQPVGPDLLADALVNASKTAYGAVMRPVEGTILTVVRESADAAAARAIESRSLVEVLDAAADAARDALARTPELLPVLAEAGVVDAGGAGYVLLLDAFLHVVDGRPLPEAPAVTPSPAAGHDPGTGAADHGAPGGPRYEVMFLLEAPDGAVEGFKQAWTAIGDSIVVVGGDGLWNCHIHCDDIGAAVEAGIAVGRPRRIAVTDLLEQVQEEQWVRQQLPGGTGAVSEAAPPAPVRAPVATAVVAVAAGRGAVEAMRALGAQEVVEGGQCMNPSTSELAAAAEATSGAAVLILPNNKNIVPVAMQVAGVVGRPVHVLPTRSVVEGAAALLAYDPGLDGAANLAAMERAAGHVVSAHVTRAVRDSGAISEGDWLGVLEGDVVVSDPDLATACTRLLDRSVGAAHELVTVIEGDGATDECTAAVGAWLAANRPSATAEVQRWGQPLSAYLFGIE